MQYTKVPKLEHESEQSAASIMERLTQLEKLRDLDLITEDVYKQKPTEILQSL